MRIVLLNPQGNFDQTDAFWTEHPDFGGQLVYVKELAISLADLGHQVDIITRRFDESRFNLFNHSIGYYDGIDHVRILRVDCGPNQFLQKEKLWPYINEWVNHIIDFYHHEGTTIDFITSHYGDGGIAGAMLSKKLNVPYSFTGHSLGAQKMDKLKLDQSNLLSLIEKYQFGKRILAERTAIQYASLVFVSTMQEKDEQYEHHVYKDVSNFQKDSRFVIASPGANLEIFGKDQPNENETWFHQKLESYLNRDIDPGRQSLPYIVSASRLDPKKNHLGLLHAYAQSKELQAVANVAISLRGVENAFESYKGLKKSEQDIMKKMMKIIRDNDLIGQVSFVNITSQAYLASSYRYFANKKSIFTLTALYEPFGLAPIEAMAAGLPVAVTKYGGPSEVLFDGSKHYGVLLDVKNIENMVDGYLTIFSQYDKFKTLGLKRVYDKYNWHSTAKAYEKAIQSLLDHPKTIYDIQIPTYFTHPEEDLDEVKIINSYYIK
jgi:sucrose-phosphate synthase